MYIASENVTLGDEHTMQCSKVTMTVVFRARVLVEII